jgi:N-acetylglucosaminyldiphosphoundecaprenol N-acetyl-beta-D-mannosaminyltransferase
MSKQTSYAKVNLLGLEVDALNIEEAIDYIIDRAIDPIAPASYVVKPYVEFMDKAAGDPALRDLLNDAELSLPDGVALLWGAHFLYGGRRSWWRFWLTLFQITTRPKALQRTLPERIAGINFTWPLLQAAAHANASVFLIGKESPRDIILTSKAIQEEIPELQVAGVYSGRDLSRPRGDVSDAWLLDVINTLQRTKPDLILVGMGFPLQERIISRLAEHLKHGVLIGEGGTFDYEQFGGTRAKAPAVMQHLGLEWFWRLILEPNRIKRQLAIPRYIWRIWRAR